MRRRKTADAYVLISTLSLTRCAYFCPASDRRPGGCAGHVDDGMLLWEMAATDDGSTPAAFERAALHAAVIRGLSRVPVDDCPPEDCSRGISALSSGKDRLTIPDRLLTPKKGDGRECRPDVAGPFDHHLIDFAASAGCTDACWPCFQGTIHVERPSASGPPMLRWHMRCSSSGKTLI